MAEMDINSVLAEILGLGAVPANVASATGSGLSRTDLNALLSQQGLGVGVGAIDPYYLEQELQRYFAREMADAEAEQQMLNERRASDERAIAAKYTTPYDPTTDWDTVGPIVKATYGQDPNVMDLFTKIESGLDVNSAYASIPELDQSDTDLYALANRFADEKKIRDNAQRNYDQRVAENQARAEAEIAALEPVRQIIAPDYEQTRREYYKDLGLDVLGMLPSAADTYRIPASAVAASRGTNDSLAAKMLAGQRQTGPSNTMNIGSGAVPASFQRPQPSAAATPAATAPSSAAYSGRAQLPAGQYATVASEKSPLMQRLASSNDPRTRAQQVLSYENLVNQKIADEIGLQLAERGYSPFQTAMQQLLDYGTMQAGS
jgi:hypothetical protein